MPSQILPDGITVQAPQSLSGILGISSYYNGRSTFSLYFWFNVGNKELSSKCKVGCTWNMAPNGFTLSICHTMHLEQYSDTSGKRSWNVCEVCRNIRFRQVNLFFITQFIVLSLNYFQAPQPSPYFALSRLLIAHRSWMAMTDFIKECFTAWFHHRHIRRILFTSESSIRSLNENQRRSISATWNKGANSSAVWWRLSMPFIFW